jgi:hypothetical protein
VSDSSSSSSSSSDAVAAALVAAVAGGALYSSCDTKATFSIPQLTTARTEPRRFMSMNNQPRNVMLHRMRSKAGRGLNDKYSVDWKTVLGEGAYGSVHPSRLACTGEKVSLVIR